MSSSPFSSFSFFLIFSFLLFLSLFSLFHLFFLFSLIFYTIAALRDQLTRDQAALDRERAGQHRLTGLLHDIFTSRPAAPASNGGQHPQADDGTGHQPAAAGGNGTSRRHAPPRLPRPPRNGPGTPARAAAPAPPAQANQR